MVGQQQAQPSLVDEPRNERVVDGLAADVELGDVEERCKRGDEIEVGGNACDDPMDRPDREALLGELDGPCERLVPTAPRPAPLVVRRDTRGMSRTGGARRRSRTVPRTQQARSIRARRCSVTIQKRCRMPSGSVQSATASSSVRSRSVSPADGERPHTAERFASQARSMSSRSLRAFGVVCSCGRIWPSGGRCSLKRTEDADRPRGRPRSSV